MTQPYFPSLALQGQTYDFSHLNPFELQVNSAIAKRDLRVHVRFTNHCFTVGYDAPAHPPGEPILLDHGQRERTFCRVRYDLSKDLPGVISNLADPAMKVWETATRRNWAHVMQIESPRGPFYVFFELKRTPVENRHLQDLNLVVESAYPQDPAEPRPSLMGRMGFLMLCGKIYTGQKTSTKR